MAGLHVEVPNFISEQHTMDVKINLHNFSALLFSNRHLIY